MDTPVYEYLHFQQIVEVSDIGKLTTPQHAAKLAASLGGAGNRLTEHMMDFERGRFEVASHSLLKVGDMLVISYLLRRISGQQNIP